MRRPAWSGACRARPPMPASAPAILPLNQIAPKARSGVRGRPLVTPLDYDFLRKLLKERSGLDLSADKQYLVESRLMPLARKAGLARHPRAGPEDEERRRGADRRGGRGDDHQRDLLLPRQDPVRSSARHHPAGADAVARRAASRCGSGRRPPRPGRSPIRSRCA